jgi:protein O-GlcNAc transferase
LAEQKQYDAAIKHLKQAVLLDPKSFNTYYILGTIADHFIGCATMSDEELSERIRTDGIDILVDLSGHTGGNRLLVFAHKPAPIQITYLDDIDTTGLSAIDYRLTNFDADPPGNDSYYSERLYRFKNQLWWCFRPAPTLPEVSPLPAFSNGFVTFSSTNHIAKISLQMIETWAEILRAVPDLRLVLMGIPDEVARQTIQDSFFENGIESKRLVCHSFMSLDQYRNLLLKTDISLDTYPFNGGTTTCETLYLGLPVIAMMGKSFVSRVGFSLLKEIGLPELVATSYKEYAEIAIELAYDIGRLCAMRSGMRERLTKSSLSDETRFTKSLEAAYQEMWANYVRQINIDK